VYGLFFALAAVCVARGVLITLFFRPSSVPADKPANAALESASAAASERQPALVPNTVGAR